MIKFPGVVELLPVKEPLVETLSTGRTYDFNGNKFPSITTVLSQTADKTHLDEWKNRVGEEEAKRVSLESSSVGSELHLLIESWVKNEPLPKTSPKAVLMFKSVVPVISKRLSYVAAIEFPLYSQSLGVAGRTDMIGVWDRDPAIIDWKSNHSNGPKNLSWVEDYRIQECFYGKAFFELFGKPIKKGVLVFANVFGCQVDKYDLDCYNEKLINRVAQFQNGERNEPSSGGTL